MQEIISFAGQNWLITPAALAAGEQPPQHKRDQKWLLVLSGVALTDFKGNSSAQWHHETFRVMPDVQAPMQRAINAHAIPAPTSGWLPEFQVEQWSPCAALGSVFNQNQSINSGFAVDVWRPHTFRTVTDVFTGQTRGDIFNGVEVDVAVRDNDAMLFRISYNFTLLGRIVFSKPGVIL